MTYFFLSGKLTNREPVLNAQAFGNFNALAFISRSFDLDL